MNKRYNEIKDFIIYNKNSNKAFRITGFYTELLTTKYNLIKEQAENAIHKLIQEGLVESIKENICDECGTMINDCYCPHCNLDLQSDSIITRFYYKITQINPEHEANNKIADETYIDHNKIAKNHHQIIVDKGYWDNPPHIGILLMLIVTEISKLFDEAKLNKPEKLADVALRLYDMSYYYNVDLSELPTVENCEMWDMINCLTCEMEAYRVNMSTKGRYIKQCLSMCYLYAEMNNVNLIAQIARKQNMIAFIDKKRI